MKLHVAMLAAVMLVGLSARALALTGNELLAACEQLEKAWVVQDNTVTFRTGKGISQLDVGRCWGYLNAYFDIIYVQFQDDPNAPPTNPPKCMSPQAGSH